MRLVLITDRRWMGAADARPAAFGAAIAAAVRGLPPRSVIVQVREKDLGGAALLALARAAVEAAPEQLVVINERLDVALAIGAAGVHLPEDGLDVEAARAAIAAAEGRALDARPDPERAAVVIGCSRHSVEDAVAAARAGAAVVQLGPVFETPSKAAYGPPLGLDAIRAARAALPRNILLVAVGGIDGPARAAETRAAGADAVAVIRAVWRAANPAAALRAFLP